MCMMVTVCVCFRRDDILRYCSLPFARMFGVVLLLFYLFIYLYLFCWPTSTKQHLLFFFNQGKTPGGSKNIIIIIIIIIIITKYI